MIKREPALYVEDILKSAKKILAYTTDLTFEDFCQNNLAVDSVVRNFTIISEASRQLPESFKEQNINIDWSQLEALSSEIVEDDVHIKHSNIWQTKETTLPLFIDQLQKL